MSVEAFVISGIVQEGDLKRAFQAGLTKECFEIYDEEFDWIVTRYESRKPFGSRLFKTKFPEFDFLIADENLMDLIEELKREQAYLAVASAIDEIYTGDDPLSQDNAMDKAFALREILGDLVRTHAPNSDVAVKAGWQEGYQHMRKLVAMRANGQAPGIPTGIAHFDHHLGGLQPETTYLFLGRPGDAKSFTLAKCVTEGAWSGYRIGVFLPK